MKTEVGSCVLCQVHVPCRKSHYIFSKKTPEEDNVADILSRILEIPVEVGLIHSEYMCLNCELICREYAGIEIRMHRIKEEVIENYNKIISTIEYVEVPAKEEIVEEVPEEAYGDEVAIYTEEDPTERSFDYDASTQGSPQEAKEETTADAEHVMILTESTTESGNEDQEHRDLCKSDEREQHESRIYTRKDNVFCCHLCPQETLIDDPTEFTMHMKGKHMQKLYICDICGMDCRRRMYLLRHLELHASDGIKQDKKKSSKDEEISLEEDVEKQEKRSLPAGPSKPWYCMLCDKSYVSKNLLEEHMNMHTGDRPYSCTKCTKTFASKYTLAAHLKIHSTRPRPYNCSVCNKKFLTGQNLSHHEKTHLGVKEYVCEVCNKAFGSSHNLRVHKIVHSGNKPFLCRTCGKSFARRAEVRDHERIHTGEKPFKCDICAMSFAQRSNLQSHKRATHLNEKRYRCEVCEKTFKRRRLLDYHTQAAHTGERPFKCTLCPSSFVYPEHLKKHLLIHSNEKKYTCEVCGKGFNNQDNRNTHRFVHSDKKPFECVQCGQGFMRKPLLFAHMKSEGHLSDTIIVNQPQLLEHPGVGESENPNIEMTSAGRSTYVISSEEAEEQMSQIIDDISIEEQIHDVDKKNIKIE
ncbi:zinc finger protein 431-like [Lutzomyia longipalpis]|uniref:zinc finger protein 431-like n=1 Tax=Lutzomyia longipalpis TaxID=7200 RepID=UPI0024833CB9|nr:zinc finger protein 431-like [Lutzomyia longipalpis]